MCNVESLTFNKSKKNRNMIIIPTVNGAGLPIKISFSIVTNALIQLTPLSF